MTNEPSPRPWRVVTYEDGSGQCDIYDANGTPVCTMGHFADKPEADAELIVDAVNERDRLRDIVRRIEAEIERCHRRDGEISQELMDAVYEASAALGAGETPTGKGVGR